MTRDGDTRTRAEWAALAACFLAPAAALLRFGYAVGYSDQDDFLPWLLHRMNPDVLGTDWFIGLQEAGVNVRTGIVSLLEPIATVVGIEPAVLLLYAAAWAILSLATFGYIHTLTSSPFASVMATVTLLALIPRWTLGGNALTSSMLVPSFVAWSLAVAALSWHVRGRSLGPGLLLAAAVWMQPLVAFTVSSALAVAGLVRYGRGRHALRQGALDLIPFALPILMSVGLLIAGLNWPGSASGSSPGGAWATELLVSFRAPHHYRPSAFPAADWIQFGLLCVAGAAGAWSGGFLQSRHARHTAGLLSTLAAFMAAGLAGEVLPAVALLQPFKATVLAGLPLTALATGGLVSLVRRRRGSGMMRLGQIAGHPLSVAGAAMVLIVSAYGSEVRRSADASIARATDWIQDSTSTGATLLVPPSATGVRFRARRPVVVTFKSVPFDAAGLAAWYRRLEDAAPGFQRPAPGAPVAALLDSLDAAYERATVDHLDSLTARYGVSYAIRRTPLSDDRLRWTPVFQEDGVTVYRHERSSLP